MCICTYSLVSPHGVHCPVLPTIWELQNIITVEFTKKAGFLSGRYWNWTAAYIKADRPIAMLYNSHAINYV